MRFRTATTASLAVSLVVLGCSQAPSERLPSSASAAAPDTRPSALPESPDEALGLRLPVRVKVLKRTDTFAEFTTESTPADLKDFLERQLDAVEVTPLPDGGGYELLGRRRVGDPGPLLHWISITKRQGLARVVMQTRADPARFVPPPRDAENLERGEVVVAGSAGEGGAPVGGLPDVNELIEKQKAGGTAP